ncbi:MAG: hypothetical protein KDC38_03070 [Planctomycetes bacterium]|nr:hypothetical protein [Planctomycetota bacterium]
MPVRFIVVVILCLGASGPWGSRASAQTFAFDLPDQAVGYDPGDGVAAFQVESTIQQTSGAPAETVAFSLAIAHDSAFLDVTGVSTVGVLAAIAGGAGPDFLGIELYPSGCSAGCLYRFDMSEPITFGSAEPVLAIDYEVDAGVLLGDANGATTNLVFDGSFALPSVANVVVVGLTELTATTDGATITFDSIVEEFIRGDVNGDGGLSLADAVAIFTFIFGGTVVDCDDAHDANDDGAIDIADGVYVLSYLFTMGPAVPSPSGACGLDPTADAIDCATSPSCP